MNTSPKLKFQLNVELDNEMGFQFMGVNAGGVDFGAGIVSMYPELKKAKEVEGDERRSLIADFAKKYYSDNKEDIERKRASNPDAAIYYLSRMVDSGEDPLFIARRMVIFASEDIGLAQPTALVVANAVFQACQQIGYPECAINLAHGVAYLSNCAKNRSAYDALRSAQADITQTGNLPIPMNLRNSPTKLMKKLGYGKDYEMYSNDDLLPDKLKGKKYF